MKKIINILLHPFIFLALWAVYLLSFFAGVMRYFYILNPETSFAILGKLANVFWHLSPVFVAIFILYLIFHIWNYIRSREIGKQRISFYIVGFFSIFAFFLANYLLFLELSNYSNYLYSTYGITKDSTFNLSSVSLITMIVFFGFIYFDRNRRPKRIIISNNKIASFLILTILIWYSHLSLVKISDYYWYVKFTHSRLFENYESILELRDSVPVSGVVIIPPQISDWPDIGNAPIVRYFLFPRIIVSSSFLTGQEGTQTFNEMYFISLHKKDLVWPVIDDKKHIINFGKSDLLYSELEVVSGAKGEKVYKIIFRK